MEKGESIQIEKINGGFNITSVEKSFVQGKIIRSSERDSGMEDQTATGVEEWNTFTKKVKSKEDVIKSVEEIIK